MSKTVFGPVENRRGATVLAHAGRRRGILAHPSLRRLSRFSVVGGCVTLFSTSANVILLKFFQTPLILTYVCVYGVSITLSYVLNSRYTFASDLSVSRLAAYFAVYLSSMALGVALLSLFRAVLAWENWVLPLMVLPCTALWNFSWSSLVLRGRREGT